MQKIKPLNRSTYGGDNIVTELLYTGGAWQSTVEHVPNAVFNNQISNKAVVLGNGPSRLDLYPNGDLFQLLNDHKGGLLAAGRLQTYGCNAIVRDFIPDFVVANDEVASELVNTGYCDKTIIYGTAAMVLSYPGKFYLVPQDPSWDMGARAAYLACFDGHTTVYLMGFDCYDSHANEQSSYNVYANTPGYPSSDSPNTEAFFIKSMEQVIKTYSHVDFVRVMPNDTYSMPDSWKYYLNLRQISFNDFVREVDL
jgi:hypothetical protein